MKASRFVKAFESDVDYWERTLSHILEVIEMIQTVQRQWMYLEVMDEDIGVRWGIVAEKRNISERTSEFFSYF